jgi:hypothetical protein
MEESQENIRQEISAIPVRQLRRLSRNMTLSGMFRSRGSSLANSSIELNYCMAEKLPRRVYRCRVPCQLLEIIQR